MPWKVSRRGSKWVVVKTTGDKRVVGTHDSKESAERQKRALYAAKGRGEMT